MPRISRTLALGSALVGTALAGAPNCPLTNSSPLSCHNNSAVANTCCFNAPGGQLLQTQFWDTNPSTGPSDSWTIHGLWPDNCDGTYEQFCDSSRAYTNITAVIGSYDPSLLQYMNTYWKSDTGSDESFWEHEWSKHGTCISTLDPKCYSSYKPAEEVYDFANRTVSLFKTLNSYSFLSGAGITPSATKTYTSAEILAALKKGHGAEPAIQCVNGALDEIWYFFNTKGSVQSGEFVAALPDGSKSSCPATGVKYLPKAGGSSQPTTSSSSTAPGHKTTRTVTHTLSQTSSPTPTPTALNRRAVHKHTTHRSSPKASSSPATSSPTPAALNRRAVHKHTTHKSTPKASSSPATSSPTPAALHRRAAHKSSSSPKPVSSPKTTPAMSSPSPSSSLHKTTYTRTKSASSSKSPSSTPHHRHG